MPGGTGNACTSRPSTSGVCRRQMSMPLVLIVLTFAFAVILRNQFMAFSSLSSSLSLPLSLPLPHVASSLSTVHSSLHSSLLPQTPSSPLSSPQPPMPTSSVTWLVHVADRVLVLLVLIIVFLHVSASRVSDRKLPRRRVVFMGRMWNSEKAFQAYLHLKLEELIQDGTTGLNAVNAYDGIHNQEGKHEEEEEEEHFSDCSSELPDESLKRDEEYRRARREAHEMVVLEAVAQLKEEGEGEEGETLNRRILMLVREGAEALAQNWTDFAAHAAADAKDDDIGADLDYFAFLCSVPDAAKSREAASWSLRLSTRIGRFPAVQTFRTAFAAIIDVSGVL